ncbi:MAG: MerR family transcriptional regulator [Sulfitobacter sp.]
MPKSPDAFRTISEVAEWLGIQAHVLRFWESKFSHIKPIKRAGGRRYYRPSDMLLLGGIRKLLHDDGLTIKGVQKILREQGVNHVSDLSAPLDDVTIGALDRDLSGTTIDSEAVEVAHDDAPDLTLDDTPAQDAAEAPDDTEKPAAAMDETRAPKTDPSTEQVEILGLKTPPPPGTDTDQTDTPADPQELPAFLHVPLAPPQDAPKDNLRNEDASETEVEVVAEPEPEPEAAQAAEEPANDDPSSEEPQPDIPDADTETARQDATADHINPDHQEIKLPIEADLPASPAVLSALSQIKSVTPDQADALRPLLEQLTALRDRTRSAIKDAHKD